MSSILELRTQLASKGYQETASVGEHLSVAPLITVHTHPLLSSPVVLIGNHSDTALPYQVTLVSAATQRK